MKYTKEQLQGMNDFDVNLALALLCGADHYVASGIIYTQVKHDGINVTSISGQANYCKNPSDIMPLAFENSLCLLSSTNTHGNKWSAVWNDAGGKWSIDDIAFYDENPLRAIACCLILVLQDKQ